MTTTLPVPTCPGCRRAGAVPADGRCPRCRTLVLRPARDADLDLPAPARVLRHLARDTVVARWITRGVRSPFLLVVLGYCMGALCLAPVHQVLLLLKGAVEALATGHLVGGLWALLILLVAVPAGLAVATVLLSNGRHLVMVGLAGGGDELSGGRVPVESVEFRPFKLRGRRAFAAYVTFRTQNLSATDRVRIELRMRGEGGKPLGASLPRYRDRYGEFVIREISQPVGVADDFRVTLGTLFPIHALVLPVAADQRCVLTAQVELSLEDEALGTHQATLDFIPRSEDYLQAMKTAAPAPDAAASVDASGFEVVAVGGRELCCPVCGDGLGDEPCYVCSLCETRHHPECWAFTDRCSTYACPGEPGQDQPSSGSPIS